VSVSFGDAYRGAFTRLDARVRELAGADPGALGTPVPACPGWTVRDVVGHLSGLAVDILGGRLTAIPDDGWTAGQVADRRARPVEDVLAEWAAHVDGMAAALDARRLPPNPAADALAHEGDVVEALGDAVPPEEGWLPAARLICRGVLRQADAPGTLTVRSGGDVWTGGSGGGPEASVEVAPWELFRGVMSRRSAAQIRAWEWTGDPGPWLPGLCVFGVRGDDQPRPEG
jgi:uncharacterized protein (TIGR03083 family)